jgi:hypothetical protein
MHTTTPTEVAKLLVTAYRSAGADRFRKARALAIEAKHDASDAAVFAKSAADLQAALARRDFYLAVCRRVDRLQLLADAVDRYRTAPSVHVVSVGVAL